MKETPEAYAGLAALYYSSNFPGYRDEKKAMNYALKAPLVHNSNYILGDIYLNGNIVPKDVKKAIQYFEKGFFFFFIYYFLYFFFFIIFDYFYYFLFFIFYFLFFIFYIFYIFYFLHFLYFFFHYFIFYIFYIILFYFILFFIFISPFYSH